MFKQVARDNGYEGQALVKKFKREINGSIRYKLIGVE